MTLRYLVSVTSRIARAESRRARYAGQLFRGPGAPPKTGGPFLAELRRAYLATLEEIAELEAALVERFDEAA